MKTQIACAGTAYRDDNGQAFDRGYKYGDVTTPFGAGRVTAHINGGFTIELCGILINGCHIEIIKEPSLAIDPKRAIPPGEVSILNRPWQYYAENVGAFDGVAEITINDAAMEVFPVAKDPRHPFSPYQHFPSATSRLLVRGSGNQSIP